MSHFHYSLHHYLRSDSSDQKSKCHLVCLSSYHSLHILARSLIFFSFKVHTELFYFSPPLQPPAQSSPSLLFYCYSPFNWSPCLSSCAQTHTYCGLILHRCPHHSPHVSHICFLSVLRIGQSLSYLLVFAGVPPVLKLFLYLGIDKLLILYVSACHFICTVSPTFTPKQSLFQAVCLLHYVYHGFSNYFLYLYTYLFSVCFHSLINFMRTEHNQIGAGYYCFSLATYAWHISDVQ